MAKVGRDARTRSLMAVVLMSALVWSGAPGRAQGAVRGPSVLPRTAFSAVSVAPAAAVSGQVPSHAELAARWAPIHHQDVDVSGGHALGGRADYLTGVDFDGDWVGRNNWEYAASSNASFAAHVYYSVLETGTHWFIGYLFYHPRDWTDHPFFETEHENDGEGVLLCVERDGSSHGTLRGAVTVAHSDFFSYTPAGSTWTAGRESVDGTLRLATSPYDGLPHPVTAQETQGHGLKAYPYYGINGDGVVYYPGVEARQPAGPDDRDVTYRLVDVFAAGGLWERRADAGLFAGHGTFAGDDDASSGSDACGVFTYDCATDAANAPWGWDDGDDVPGRGEIATDPATLVAEYFTVPGGLSRTYTVNPYGAATGASDRSGLASAAVGVPAGG